MPNMEEAILNGLKLLKYDGELSNKQFHSIIYDPVTSPSFIQLVVWLSNQLKHLCTLEETVAGDSGTFVIDVRGFVRELGFPYGEILQTNGLDSSKGRLFLLDFLVSELQACRMNLCEDVDAANEKTEFMDVDHNVAPKYIEIITNTLHVPITPSVSELFVQIEAKIKELLTKLPPNYMKNQLLNKSLSPTQWEKVVKLNDAMCAEYKKRRQLLIKRFDVTLQSFTWSQKIKNSMEPFAELVQISRGQLIADSPISIVDILAARTDLCIIAKTSSGEEREATKCDINRIKIGKVPDRGGRPSNVAPPPEMPKFQRRQPDPSRGGGRGGGGGSLDRSDSSSSGGYGKGGSDRGRRYDRGRGGHKGSGDWSDRGQQSYGPGKSHQEPKMYYS